MKINCIAVDDEPPALMQMEDFISKVPFLNLMSTFDNAMETLEFLKNNEVDLVFLDIEMEGFTGLQLLKIIKQKPKIILTTAYDQYAIQAFDLDVTDYLLKPISFERFVKATEKVYDNIHQEKQHSQLHNPLNIQEEKTCIFVKTEYRIQRVDFREILYIEGLKEYLIIKTTAGRVITLQSFKHIEEMLPHSNFIRVHKSWMVAIDKIESIERNHIRIADKLIPVGDTYRKNFMNALNSLSI